MTNQEAIELLKDHEYWTDFSWMDEVAEMAIEALEKVDKYRWHDLRKDPDDLPKVDGEYRVFLKEGTAPINLYYCCSLNAWGDWAYEIHDELISCPAEYYFEPIDEDEIPICWKIDEYVPFEVE